jgi:hypothetical protein
MRFEPRPLLKSKGTTAKRKGSASDSGVPTGADCAPWGGVSRGPGQSPVSFVLTIRALPDIAVDP